jgi:hypothetical protein
LNLPIRTNLLAVVVLPCGFPHGRGPGIWPTIQAARIGLTLQTALRLFALTIFLGLTKISPFFPCPVPQTHVQVSGIK